MYMYENGLQGPCPASRIAHSVQRAVLVRNRDNESVSASRRPSVLYESDAGHCTVYLGTIAPPTLLIAAKGQVERQNYRLP